jgi:hypothetical protein
VALPACSTCKGGHTTSSDQGPRACGIPALPRITPGRLRLVGFVIGSLTRKSVISPSFLATVVTLFSAAREWRPLDVAMTAPGR